MSLELRLFISKAQLFISNEWALLLQLFLTVIDVKPNICNGIKKKIDQMKLVHFNFSSNL